MASSTHQLLFGFTIFFAILSISAAARPCKTLLISSYSFSFSNPSNPNPNSNNPSSTTGYVTIFTEIRQFNPRRPQFFFDRPFFPADFEEQPRPLPQQQQKQLSLFGYGGYDFSSLRDRTKDILSVVVALLFGVGCGALTAVTMYLVWTLFASRYDYRNSSYDEFSDGDDDDHDEDDVFSPKKMGYEKIPAKEAA